VNNSPAILCRLPYGTPAGTHTRRILVTTMSETLRLTDGEADVIKIELQEAIKGTNPKKPKEYLRDIERVLEKLEAEEDDR